MSKFSDHKPKTWFWAHVLLWFSVAANCMAIVQNMRSEERLRGMAAKIEREGDRMWRAAEIVAPDHPSMGKRKVTELPIY